MTKLSIAHLAIAATLGLSLLGCEDDDGDGKTDASDARASDASDAVASETAAATDGATDRSDASADTVVTDAPAGETVTTDAVAGDGGASAEKVARGKYIVDVVASCTDCHTPRLPTGMPDMNNYLAGDNTPAPNCLFRNPATNDCLYPRNLTNDATGLKNRTDAEIKNMFQNGKRPIPPGTTDGGASEEALHPAMPYYIYKHMSDADADAVVAYLRTVPAKDRAIPRRGASFDVPAPAPPVTLAKIPTPRQDYPFPQAAMRGRYLTSQAGLCLECHSTRLPPGPGPVLDEDKLFWGGNDFTGILGPMVVIKSKNLTPDVATGLGSWTFEQIADALKNNKDKDGMGICPPMPRYGQLSEQDASDIVHYLRSIPPAANAVADMCVAPMM